MPTYAHATVVAHLSADPELKIGSNGKPYTQVRAWTKAKDWKDKSVTHFTTWRGILSGTQAEWLCIDGKKGSMVVMSGTVRVDMYTPDGKDPRASIEFTRMEECRLLDRAEAGEDNAGSAKPKAPPRAAHAADLDDASVPF
jgi:single-stranded DNA-binding protein